MLRSAITWSASSVHAFMTCRYFWINARGNIVEAELVPVLRVEVPFVSFSSAACACQLTCTIQIYCVLSNPGSTPHGQDHVLIQLRDLHWYEWVNKAKVLTTMYELAQLRRSSAQEVHTQPFPR